MDNLPDFAKLNVSGFSVGDYVCKGGRGSLLGKGSFADVYLGIHKKDGTKVAIKVIDVARLTKDKASFRQHLALEAQLLKKLDHENIVKLFDVFVVFFHVDASFGTTYIPYTYIYMHKDIHIHIYRQYI